MIFTTENKEETIALGQKVGARLKVGDIIAMEGDLGAGKTTITKGIADSLGVKEEVTSPTFTLISEYEGKIPLYHIDVYRLAGESDFEDIGGNDLLYGSGVCIIEWSEKIKECLPDSTIYLKIKIKNDNRRIIDIDNWHYGNIL